MRREVTQLTANGLDFDADVAGEPDGPLVLLLHGFPQTRHAWRHQLPALAEAGFFAVAPDQRGYSPGARPQGVDAYATATLVEDVMRLADVLGRTRFHLVGHDWGGQLAWLAAARHGARLESLTVLSRPHPAAFARAVADDPEQRGRSRHHRAFRDAAATDRLLADDCAALRRSLEEQGVPAADVAAYLETLGHRPALDAAIHWYRAAGRSGLARECPPVGVPTLYLWGDRDATVGRDAAEATAAFVTGSYRFVEVPGAGHFLTDQEPEAVTRELLEHLGTDR